MYLIPTNERVICSLKRDSNDLEEINEFYVYTNIVSV